VFMKGAEVKTYRERTSGSKTSYIQINEGNVTIGLHFGSGHSDNAGTCNYNEFLNGGFHDIIL